MAPPYRKAGPLFYGGKIEGVFYRRGHGTRAALPVRQRANGARVQGMADRGLCRTACDDGTATLPRWDARGRQGGAQWRTAAADRSEEHTSELQSLMRISYAVF